MKIDATNNDLYLASINQIQQQNNQNNIVKKAEERKDSYIHSISAQDMAVPSGTYDANGRMVGELPPVASVNTDSDTNTDSSFLSLSGAEVTSNEVMAGGAGGGSGSEEETTTTKIVTINGVTYLKKPLLKTAFPQRQELKLAERKNTDIRSN